MLALSLAWFIAVIVLIARALRQRSLFRDIKEERFSGSEPPAITIIVPARNEEQNIGPCLRSLLAQRYPAHRLSIIAIDDHSSDRTAEIIGSLAAASGRVRLLDAPPLPYGWTGKSNACWAGALAAGESEWLCFVDADIEASAGLIESAVAVACAEKIGFLSLTPRQTLVTFSERLMLPCGLYLLSFSQDLGTANSPASAEVSATGQFLLIRGDVYKAIGGHEAVRRDICEDVALARLSKRQGFKTALFGGTNLYSTRMYTGWETLWPGITKNLADMLGGPARAVLTTVIALTLAWAAPILPAVDAFKCSSSTTACVALASALPASLAAFAFHVSGAAFFRIPFWYGLIFPLGYTVGAALAIDSVRRRLTGRIRWKGRVYQ